MNTKWLLLACFLIGATPFTATAMAQNAKPGQRMIYDDRLPEEPPALDRPIFNKRIIAPPSAPEPADEPAPEAGAAQDGQTGTSGESGTAEGEGAGRDREQPPLYVSPQDTEAEAPDAEIDGAGASNDSGEVNFDTMPPRKRQKLESMADDITRKMPHKDLTPEQIQNLSPEERKRVRDDIETYVNKNSPRIKKELAD